MADMLRNKLKGINGFTLAELMMVATIILILSITAVTTVVAISKNMLMTELDATAAELAQAAQNEMTALKVSGTWIEKLDEVVPAKANMLPGSVGPANDIYYLTAEQAKSMGVVKALTIESHIYNSDFIVEFSRSTATVYSVFFANGKTNFFSDSTNATLAAKTYYESMKTADAREKQDRIAASPPVGYSQGTPAGATETVVLENPAIWIDPATSNLCVQNINLKNPTGASWAVDSILKVSITLDDGVAQGASFTLSELVRELNQYEISGAGLDPFSQTNVAEISLFARDGVNPPDTFNISLSQILTIMSFTSEGYKTLTDAFAPGDRVRIDAEIEAPPGSPACEIARSTAYFAFPSSSSDLKIMVTNPDPRAFGQSRPSHTNGQYTAPTVAIIPESGTYITKYIQPAQPEQFNIPNTSSALKNTNPQEGYQGYTGGSIAHNVIDDAMLIQVEAPWYKAPGKDNEGFEYYSQVYQIYEIWLAGAVKTRIGYEQNEVFVWLDEQKFAAGDPRHGRLKTKIRPWHSKNNGYYDQFNSSTGAKIDPYGFTALCQNLGLAPNESGGYTLYIKCAPRMDNVLRFYEKTNLMYDIAAGATANIRETTSTAATIRNKFEKQFGASSSVSLLTISRQAGGANGENSGIPGFPVNSSGYRIYYSYTPALGFASGLNQATLKLEAFRPQSASLLFYKATKPAGWQHYAMVRPSAQGGMPEDIYLTLDSTGSVFAIPHQQDPLFYRALFYYNDDAATQLTAEFNPQYAPYTGRDTMNQAKEPLTAPRIQSYQATKSWYTTDVQSGSSMPVASVSGGNLVMSYDSQLKHGRINLRTISPGLMYLEFNGSTLTGYQGHTNAGAYKSNLSSTNAKTNSGYYAIVPDGVGAPSVQYSAYNRNNNTASSTAAVNISTTPVVTVIDGTTYYAYRINSNRSGEAAMMANDATNYSRLADYQKIDINLSGTTKTYFANVLFAGAVTNNVGSANNWGTASSPYLVRNADQLWGYFPRVYQNDATALESAYRSKHFLQTHSFDMTNYQGKGTSGNFSRASVTFVGNYNGDLHEITGYKVSATTTDAGYSTAHFNSLGGLFPHVENGGVLKNVRMVNTSPDAFVVDGMGNRVQIGVLAGRVVGSNTLIDNCSATGFSYTVTIKNKTSINVIVGGLTGYLVSGAKMTNCSISELDLKVHGSKVAVSQTNIMIGGLVGWLQNGPSLSGGSATNVNIEVEAPEKGTWGAAGRTCANLSIGGLAGNTAGTVSVSESKVAGANINIKGATWTSFSPGSLVWRMQVGGLVGLVHTGSTITGNTVESVNVQATGDQPRLYDGNSGFGALAGFSRGSTYTNNKVDLVHFYYGWTDSMLSDPAHPDITWTGTMVGWADSRSANIASGNTFANITKTVVDKDSAPQNTSNVVDTIGRSLGADAYL